MVVLVAACGAPSPTLTSPPTSTVSPTVRPSSQPTSTGQPTQTDQPTTSAEPISTDLPTASAEVGWIPLATAPDGAAVWSPDARHVAVSLINPGGPPEAQSVAILTRDGTLVRSHPQVTDPVWIDGESFVVYRLDWRQDESGEWYAETGPNGERMGGVLQGSVDSDDLAELVLPLGPALSNGRGALAVGGFDQVGAPETAVWSDGVLGQWRAGRTAGWSAAGDRLALIHPGRSGPADEGWVEVLDWPAMSTTWASDESLRVGNALFDPTGVVIAYPEYAELPTPPRQVPQFELTVRIVDLASGEIGGFTARENGQFVWDADGNMVVVGFDSKRAVRYDRAGNVLAEVNVVGPHVLGSADGSTLLFYDRGLDEPPMQVMRGGGLSELTSPGTMAGSAPALAADGSGVLVVVRSAAAVPGRNPPATVLLHQL